MNNSSLDYNRFKIQLKARLRVPILMKSKRLNFEFSKFFDTPQLGDIDMSTYTQSRLRMNKSYIYGFTKFSLKTNLIKRVLSNMSIKDIYEEEKYCSRRCKEVINDMDLKNGSLDFINLPLIKQDNKFPKKKIILKNLKINQKKIKPLILKNIKQRYQNTSLLSSSNKFSSYIESTKEKSKEPKTTKIKSKIEFKPRNIFKFNENFTILKGGGIKYNNSMYRLKNMNDFLKFKI